MRSSNVLEENCRAVIGALSEAVLKGSKFVTFPENCLFFRYSEKDAFPEIGLAQPFFKDLETLSRSKRCLIHLGSLPLIEEGRRYNATVVVHPDRGAYVAYRKIHLFDVDVANHQAVRESDSFFSGREPQILEFEGWKIGLSICYDLRFSELFAFYQREGVHLILIPSSFLVPTGQAHWEVLIRARAIEAQAYVLAAAQGGAHSANKNTFGRSMVVDPWGKILKVAGEEPGLLFEDLSLAKVEDVRRQIPMSKHRKKIL